MKAAELREKSVEELNAELLELFKTHFSLRMQLASQQLNNTSELRKIKKQIARVKTVIAEKGAQ